MRVFVIGVLSIFLFSCKKDDTTPPELQLIGSDTITQSLPTAAGGGYYLDPGVLARDNEDGNITGNILVENLVNPNKKGSYLVKYFVKDEAGNESRVQRVVNIINSAEKYAGVYLNCDDTCTTSNISYATTVQSSDTVNRLIRIANFGNISGIGIYASVTDSTVSVPLNQFLDLSMTKYINNVFFPLTGVLSPIAPTSLRIKFSWTDGSVTDTCTTWLAR